MLLAIDRRNGEEEVEDPLMTTTMVVMARSKEVKMALYIIYKGCNKMSKCPRVDEQ
jgi:hypothetical protein